MEFSRSADISESSERERGWVELNQLTARSAAGVSNFDVFREAECIKQESRQFINCDAGSALEQSTEAEKEMYSGLADKLRIEMEEANVERVFIDLARAKAEREYTEIKAQREAEAAQFDRKIETTSSKIRSLSKELNAAKELEAELMATYQDLNALQNEMEFIKVMERSSENKRLSDKLELASSQAELEAARKELLSLREEGFKLMAEMDNIRGESIEIAEEREQLVKSGKKREADLRSVNSNLHKAISKLELAASAEKRAGAVVANLSTALQQLQSDVAVAKREAELTNQEVSAIQEETAQMYLTIKFYEERLRDAAKELEAGKELEAVALEQLQTLTDSTMRERAIAALFCSTITLSRFEYYYLINHARSAQEVADMKVAAAEACTEAIQAREKEMHFLMAETTRRDDFMRRKNKKTEERLTSSREHDQERELAEPLKPKLAIAMPRRSITLGRGGLAAMQPRRSITLAGGVAVAGESGTVRKVRRSSSLLPTTRSSTTRPQPAFASRRKVVVHRLVNFLSWRVRKN
ncbi:protein PLASTID MOVEMENT IMPAIRED 15-like [Ananas comosus]|uniref:Protein PLASTID MOVEMENT IMPAIRED 15-like n=1 Tax=Ananas comosus TaxID=4615 RepID=A0A6P5FN06_ANACO|nr:protein PLASTID MOVEMENT IMPAIRED 15-like [Ananas comosus]XP_020097027.1 protein PLASTID MOVEMENT IMPAIRED 15-like [Ananas comosus]